MNAKRSPCHLRFHEDGCYRNAGHSSGHDARIDQEAIRNFGVATCKSQRSKAPQIEPCGRGSGPRWDPDGPPRRPI